MKSIVFALMTTLIFSCNNDEKKEVIQKDEALEELFDLMQGSFNSERQAAQDSSFYNISLHMYPIWKDKGHFLYVEQALNSMQDKPYRQRVYELKRSSDSTIASYVYTLPNDSLFIGNYKNPKAFSNLTLDSLSLRSGCEVVLKKINENTFKGSTGETSCESTLRGASYATSEVEITKTKITSWDRGFDAEGNHVWGAEKGGYVFDKLQ